MRGILARFGGMDLYVDFPFPSFYEDIGQLSGDATGNAEMEHRLKRSRADLQSSCTVGNHPRALQEGKGV